MTGLERGGKGTLGERGCPRWLAIHTQVEQAHMERRLGSSVLVSHPPFIPQRTGLCLIS